MAGCNRAAVAVIAAGLVGVGLAAFVVALVALERRGERRRLAFLSELARALDGTSDRRAAQGTIHGVPVILSLTTRGSGKSSSRWTEIECPLPTGCPLSMHVRRHGLFDTGAIARGAMVDVTVGDRAFDAAFRVEAAPAEVVRQMLDVPVRALLVRHDLELSTVGTRLRLERRGWWSDAVVAAGACRVAVHLVRSLRAAHAALDAAAEPPAGEAYRGFVSDAPVLAARAARDHEVARVEALVGRRHTRLPWIIAGAALVMLAVLRALST